MLQNKGLTLFLSPRLFHLMPDLEVELYGNTVKRQKVGLSTPRES